MNKKLLLIFAVFQTVNLYALQLDSTAMTAASYFAEAKQASAGQKIWSQKLYGPMLFVDAVARTTWANVPDNGGVLKKEGEVYKGILPKSVMLANTSVTWGGRKWSMILWPLPARKDDRLNLILHESFHRIQDKLNLPAHSPTADDLSTKDGRVYFLLEMQALKSALSKPKNERDADLASALLFREKRSQLFPESFKHEQILEANEGFAEYTGVILGRSKQTIAPYLKTVIDNAEKKESLIRSAAYITGPVYGYLLYEADPKWTSKVDSSSNFADLVKKYYRVKSINGNIDEEIKKRLDNYKGERIIASENLKYEQHQKLEKQYLEQFTVKPVLIISLVNMHIGFNPNNLFDLGKYGTVYPTMTLTDKWGSLQVAEGTGALMKNWQVVYLSLEKSTGLDTKTIEGDGWKLMLENGWKVIPDASNYKLVKE